MDEITRLTEALQRAIAERDIRRADVQAAADYYAVAEGNARLAQAALIAAQRRGEAAPLRAVEETDVAKGA
jgi:predicted Abi (CAAX) family protease